jgi:hypothetical protein
MMFDPDDPPDEDLPSGTGKGPHEDWLDWPMFLFLCVLTLCWALAGWPWPEWGLK